MWSARLAVPVPWQRGHRGPGGSTVVYRWIGTCSVTEEVKAGGTDDVCEWWLISTSTDLLITGSIARSANLPVFSLLRGQF